MRSHGGGMGKENNTHHKLSALHVLGAAPDDKTALFSAVGKWLASDNHFICHLSFIWYHQEGFYFNKHEQSFLISR